MLSVSPFRDPFVCTTSTSVPSAGALSREGSTFSWAAFSFLRSSLAKLENCLSNELAAPSHARTVTISMPPRYGVEFAKEPNVRIMNCWISAPPDLPSGLQTTSMAAFPLTCRQRELSWLARYNSGADCRPSRIIDPATHDSKFKDKTL